MTVENQWGSLRRPDVFEEEYVPEIMLFRETATAQFSECIRPLMRGEKPVNMWIQGPSGSGKTCLVKSMLRTLSKDHRAKISYVNCYECDTLCKVLDSLTELRSYNSFIYKVSDKIKKLQEACKEKHRFIVLDEIDRLSSYEMNAVIYTLAGIKNVTLICLTTNQHFFLNLDQRASSRFCPAVIRLAFYSEDELGFILEERMRIGLSSIFCAEECLREIARQSMGNARLAILALRNAMMIAEGQGVAELNAKVLKESFAGMRDMKQDQLLDGLNHHELLIYGIVRGSPGIHSDQLRKAYSKGCKAKKLKPVAPRTYSKYCERLAQKGFVRKERALVRGNIWRYQDVHNHIYRESESSRR